MPADDWQPIETAIATDIDSMTQESETVLLLVDGSPVLGRWGRIGNTWGWITENGEHLGYYTPTHWKPAR